jgi:hypothetical protein
MEKSGLADCLPFLDNKSHPVARLGLVNMINRCKTVKLTHYRGRGLQVFPGILFEGRLLWRQI